MPPRRMPAKVRRLHGETRPSHLRNEPQPLEQEPDPPEWLTPPGRAVWDRAVEQLRGMGILFTSDTEAIATYASSAALLGVAERALAAEGYVIDDPAHPGRQRRNPWVMVRREAIDGVMRFGSLLGFSPVARAHIDTTPKEPYDPADELLSG